MCHARQPCLDATPPAGYTGGVKTTPANQPTSSKKPARGRGRPRTVGESVVVKLRLLAPLHRAVVARAEAERRTQREVISAAIGKYLAEENP